MQVWRVVFAIGMKAMLDGTLEREIARARERDRERLLEELDCALRSAGATPDTYPLRGNLGPAAGVGCKNWVKTPIYRSI